MKPTVSVIIPNYNYARFLSETLESVLQQTYQCHEIIVVDDGSTDNSLEVAAEFQNRGVQVIQQQNGGVGAARNTGVQRSTGEIIAFLDADDVWLPEKIEKQVEKFVSDDEIGLVSCGMREFNEQGATIGEYRSNLSGWCAEEFVTFKNPVVVSGSAIAVRRRVFEQTGGFDLRREMHPSEDWEFCYRLSLISKIAVLPELLVDYRNHGANGHLKIPKMERAMMLAYEKIFAQADAKTLQLKNESYGNLHTTLAGCYFQTGDYPAFLRHTTRSLWYTPHNINRYLDFPRRFWQRRFSAKQPLPTERG